MNTPEASISALMMSIASSAAMAMGLAPHPENGEVKQDKVMARFNIDLLLVLQEKTLGNLTTDENPFLTNVISDLQMRFLELK